MCMSIDPNVVPVFNDEGWGTFYKFVEAEDNCSPYYSTEYVPGVLTSTRPSKEITPKDRIQNFIEAGIHVILGLDDIRYLVSSNSYTVDMRIIKILAHQDHLVSAGWWNANKAAVFTQVTVPDDFELEVIEGVEEEEDDYDDEDDDDWDDEDDDYEDEDEDL